MNRKLITRNESPFYNLAKKFFNEDFDYFNYYPNFKSNSIGLSNISENDNEYIIDLQAPGFKKDNIRIEIENDILKIYSNIEENNEDVREGYYKKEFFKSSFERFFTIPDSVDKNNISASMNDGILTVNIPKVKEEKKPESIKISIK